MHTIRVFLALLPFAISFLRDYRGWIWLGQGVQRTAEDHQRRARALVATVVTLGPTFVKLAQVFASRADLIPEPYLSELGTLIDQVPPLPFSAVEKTIVEAYGRPVDSVFEAFERTPVAAASLGQVHRARYKGKVVAVKVLRPHVEQRVANDLLAARRIHRWVARWWKHPHVARIEVVLNEFELRIGEEMDFRLEAEYATEIRANFAGNAHVIVPEIVQELVRQRVLVMDFIDGTRIDKLDATRVDVNRVVATLVELYVQMMLVDGLFHADPHPGNLMLAPDGRIVLIDFGMTVRVPIETRRALVHTSIAAIRKDPAAVAKGFDELGLILPGTDQATVEWLAQLLIVNAYSKTTARERIDTLMADRVMKTLFDFPIVMPQHLVYFGRTAALIEGIGTRYDPYFQAIPIASPVILRMRVRILKSLGEKVDLRLSDVAVAGGYALGRAARWLVDRVPGNLGALRKVLPLVVLLLAAANCASVQRASPLVPAPASGVAASGVRHAESGDNNSMSDDVRHAIEMRIADLKLRGGDCAVYGEVLERSYAAGQISLRPYMWRVGANLAAGEAHPSGQITLAREVDSLNVGVWTTSDLTWSAEHEAVHIAFQVASGSPANEERVDSYVRACRSK